MIKSFTFINEKEASLHLDFLNRENDVLSIISVTGLSPEKATINTTQLSSGDGAIFNSARVEQRNIVFQFRYKTTQEVSSIESIRQMTYKFFGIKKPVTIIVETDNRKLVISGYTESNEVDIFSEIETATVSVICPDPNFYDFYDNNIILNPTRSLFTFPFAITTPTELSDIMEQSEIKFDYVGEIDIGIMFTLKFSGSTGNVSIYKAGELTNMTIDMNKIESMTGEAVGEGDEIVITTFNGDKGVKLMRGGTAINILNCINRPTNWLSLEQGENIFGYYAETGGENVSLRIDFKTAYEGI